MGKTLIAYFSASGVTARAAKEMAEAVGAESVPENYSTMHWTNIGYLDLRKEQRHLVPCFDGIWIPLH